MAETAEERYEKLRQRAAKKAKATGAERPGVSPEAQARYEQMKARAAGKNPEATKGKAPSLLEQAKHAASGLPKALLQIPVMAAKDVGSLVTTVADPRAGKEGSAQSRRAGESNIEWTARKYPLLGGLAQSFLGTADKVGELGAVPFGASGIEDTTYAREVKEGRILASVLEDVGNVSMAGYGAGRVAGRVAKSGSSLAPAAARVEQAVGNAARLSGDVASLPAKPYLLAAKGIKAGAVKSGVGPLVANLPMTTGTTKRVIGKGLVPEADVPDGGRVTLGQAVSGKLRSMAESREYRERVLVPMNEEIATGLKRYDRLAALANKHLPDPDARHAVQLVQGGQGPVVAIARSLTGQARHDYIREVWGSEHTPSARTLDYVAGFIAGDGPGGLPGDVRAAMTKAWEPMRRAQQEIHEVNQLAGLGMKNPMNPEQLGNVPMEQQIARLTDDLRDKADRIRADLEGDRARGIPGLRAEVAGQRARVGAPDLAAAIPDRAIGRVERAAATAAEEGLLRSTEARLTGASQRAAADADALVQRPFPTADVRLLSGVERQAVKATDATRAQRAASSEAVEARGTIGETVTREERGVAAQRRNERRSEAEVLLDDARGEYDRIYDAGSSLKRPPKRKRVGTDPITRRPVYSRGAGGEWDWWDQLSPAQQKRLMRSGYVSRDGRGLTPDQIEQMARNANDAPGLRSSPGDNVGYEGGLTEAMDDWVARVTRIDDLREQARTGGVSRAEEAATVAARGPDTVFDNPRYNAAEWADDYHAAVASLKAAPKGTAEHTAAAARYAELVPDGLFDEVARLNADRPTPLTFEDVYDLAHDLARAESAKRFSPAGRLNAAEERVRAALDAKSSKGLTAPERKLYASVTAAMKGEAADTMLSAARNRSIERIVAAVAPELRRQGQAIGRAEGRSTALAGEASLAGNMAATREARLGGMDPQADLVAGMDVARRRLAPQIARDVKANIAESKLVRQERALLRAEAKVAKAEDWLREGKVDPSGRKDAVPGRYASPLLNASTARRALTDMADDLDAASGAGAGQYLRDMANDLPETMAQLDAYMQSHGLDLDYIIGGPEERLGGGSRIGGGGATTPQQRRVSSSRQKKEGRVTKSFSATSRLMAEALKDAVENKTVDVIAQEYALDARTVLERGGHIDPVEIDRLVTRGGQQLAKAIEREGFTEWNRYGRPGGMEAQKADTQYLPTPLSKEFQRYFKPALNNPLTRILDVPTRTWKHLVLALNPMWQVGNIVGAAMLAGGGAGMTPLEMVKYAREAKQLLNIERDTGVLQFPARLHHAGQGGELLRGLPEGEGWSIAPQRIGGRTKPGGGRVVPEGVRHPIQASYNFNGFIDDWGRAAVYLAKKSKGLSDEQAVRLSLRAMGDFTNMSPFERDIVRRVLPFYAWSRHVTQLAGHLAVEHPLRVAWMLHLGANYGGGADAAVEGTPSFISGAIRLPNGGVLDSVADRILGDNGDVDRFIGMRSLNPYGDLASLPFTSAKELGRGANPVIKGGAFFVGFNLGKARPVSGPPGTQGRSEYGGVELRRSKLSEMVYWLSQQSNPTRLAASVIQDPVVRYDTGDPMRLKGQDIPLEGGKREAIIRNLGVPFTPTTFDEERQRARVEAVRKRDERSRRNYQR